MPAPLPALREYDPKYSSCAERSIRVSQPAVGANSRTHPASKADLAVQLRITFLEKNPSGVGRGRHTSEYPPADRCDGCNPLSAPLPRRRPNAP